MPQPLERPKLYACCMVKDGECPLMDKCLRSKVWRENADELSTLTNAVNIRHPQVNACTEQCSEFRTLEKKRFARGMKHLFDPVPKATYKKLRPQVEDCFTSRPVFFRCRRGDLLVSHDEQNAIAEIFRNAGIENPPSFDGYEEAFDWD